MLDITDELRALVEKLDEHEIEYALCGGMAMAVHGHPRATVDIDILLLGESLEATITIAEQLGYTVRGLNMSFADGGIEIQRRSKIIPTTRVLLTLDMLLVTDLIRHVWETRTNARWEGRKLSVVSRDGLIALKQISGRPQDIADIAALKEDSDGKS